MTEHHQNQRVLRVFANRQPAQELELLLGTFYWGAQANKIGIMQALNSETNEEEVLLVGFDETAEGEFDCMPLAKVLKAEDVTKYRHPDGKGGWGDVEAQDGTNPE